MGFDGQHFFVRFNGVVIAKRGLGDLKDDAGTYNRLRTWTCVEPGWSVVETNRPKRSGMGDLHFKYDPTKPEMRQ
jgi:hypothetical protein